MNGLRGIYFIEYQSSQDLGMKAGGFSWHKKRVPGYLQDLSDLGRINKEDHLIISRED